MFTAEDIRSEHLAAKASLTPAQIRMIAAERQADRMACFCGETYQARLQAEFERQAEARNRALDERQR